MDILIILKKKPVKTSFSCSWCWAVFLECAVSLKPGLILLHLKAGLHNGPFGDDYEDGRRDA